VVSVDPTSVPGIPKNLCKILNICHKEKRGRRDNVTNVEYAVNKHMVHARCSVSMFLTILHHEASYYFNPYPNPTNLTLNLHMLLGI